MVDVLVVTALKLEFEAAKDVATSPAPGSLGVGRWDERDRDEMAPYWLGEFLVPGGISLSIALARSVHMGGREVSPVTSMLVGKLHPRCLAMGGVTAGNPERAAPGHGHGKVAECLSCDVW